MERAKELWERINSELSKVIIGKEDIKRLLMVALLSEGHVLIEGLPGTGKTKLAMSFARIIGGDFKRVQMTPDMLPADITGFYIYSPDGNSRLIKGPIFTNILLADELNRATPRTQSALLQAMQEYEVTIERDTFKLKKPFMVIATQQIFGAEGTYPLTNVQADRFMFSVMSGYPSFEEERDIIMNIDIIDEPSIGEVASLEEIREVQGLVRKVYVSPPVVEYMISLINRLREEPDVEEGPSPRGSIALYKGSRALALLDGRDFVIPDDVKSIFLPSTAHRIRLRHEAEMEGITREEVIKNVLDKVEVPKVKI